jgi:hypothetical protein
MNNLRTVVIIRKKITTLAGYGDWTNLNDSLVVNNVSNIKISRALGGETARRDTFSFSLNNWDNTLYEVYYNGTSIKKVFELPVSNIPIDHRIDGGNWQKLYVYVNGVYKKYGTDFTISGGNISFTVAPPTGNRNVLIKYPIVEVNDLCRIYRFKDKDFEDLTEEELLQAMEEGIEGVVSELNLDKQDRNSLEVQGIGLIDAMMSGMAFSKNPTTYPYSHLQIQEIISQLNQNNLNREIYGKDPVEWNKIKGVTNQLNGGINDSDATIVVDSTEGFRTPQKNEEGELMACQIVIDNEAINYTGITATSFTGCTRGEDNTTEAAHLDNATVYQGNDISTKNIPYSSKYKTAVEIVQDVSRSTYTGNGQYIFYINFNSTAPAPTATGYQGRYEFVWRQKQNIDESAEAFEEGVDALERIESGKTTDDVVNAVIYNAGKDLYGHGIEGLNYDFSYTAYGMKWRYVSETSYVFDHITSLEISNNKAQFEVDSDGKVASRFPTAYPYTFVTVKERDPFTKAQIVGAAALSASDAKEYNKILKNEAEAVAWLMTKRILELFSKPRFTVKMHFIRESDREFALGAVHPILVKSLGIDRWMRIYQIDYNYQNTIVTFKEDEVTLKPLITRGREM